jgi:hypothetical protein
LYQVPANFKILGREGELEPFYNITPTSGTLKPGEDIDVSVTYTPTAAGHCSVDYFEISTVSGNSVPIGLRGKGAGVFLSQYED